MFSDSDEYINWIDEKILQCAYNNKKIRNKMIARYAWKNISYMISFAEQNYEKYELIHQCIFDMDIEIYQEIIAEMSKDDIIFGYCLHVFGKKDSEPERYRILLKYVTLKNDCLDCFINTAKSDGQINILEEIYFAIWKGYVKSDVSINLLIDELYRQEKKLEVLGKAYQRSIMLDFRKLFQEKGAFEIKTIKNVFSGNDADVTSLSFKTVRFMNHCIKNYSWDSKFIQNRRTMPDDIYDSLKTRQMLDDIILDQNFYTSSERDTVLKYLFADNRKSTIQEFQGYIKASIDKRTQNIQSKAPTEENIALLGLLSMMNLRRKDYNSTFAWIYLNLLNAGSDTLNEKTMTWRGYGYLMFGLKWLCIMEHLGVVIINNISGYKASFVSLFAKNIDLRRKKYILECRETYEKYVKNDIDELLRRQLAFSAKKSKDGELMSIFPVEKESAVSSIKSHIQSVLSQKNPPHPYIPQKERSDDN